jgi:hypothetical protein
LSGAFEEEEEEEEEEREGGFQKVLGVPRRRRTRLRSVRRWELSNQQSWPISAAQWI